MLRLPTKGLSLIAVGALIYSGAVCAEESFAKDPAKAEDRADRRADLRSESKADKDAYNVAAAAMTAGTDEVPFVEGQKPPPAQEGEIWCLVTKPAMTRRVTEQVMVRPGTFYYEAVPAKYAWKEETVMISPEKKTALSVAAVTKKEMVRKMVKAESIDYQVVPAQFEWVDEVVETSQEKDSIVVNDAKYRAVTEQVMVEPARTEWKKINCDEKGVVIHRRESKDDCYAILTTPAKYQTVTRQVLDKDISTDTQRVRGASKTIKVQKVVREPEIKKVIIPAQYEMVETEVVVAPASVAYQSVPAQFDVVKKLVMVEPEQKQKVDVPPKYDVVTKEIVDQPSTLVWRRKKGDFVPPAPRKEVVEKPEVVVERYGSLPGITSDDAEKEDKKIKDGKKK